MGQNLAVFAPDMVADFHVRHSLLKAHSIFKSKNDVAIYYFH